MVANYHDCYRVYSIQVITKQRSPDALKSRGQMPKDRIEFRRDSTYSQIARGPDIDVDSN